MGLIVQKEVKDSTLILSLKGILDISTSNKMEPYINEISDIECLIFDFNELDFIDSTGIGSIMNAIYLSKEKNFKLILRGVDELTDEVFRTVGLYYVLETIQEDLV